MATIQERETSKGETRYRVQVRVKGYPPQSASFKRKTDAKLWASQTEAAIHEGRHFKTAEAKKHNLAEAIGRYTRNVLPSKPSLKADQTQQLAWWKEQIGSYLLSDITPALIAEHRDTRLAAGGNGGG